MSSTIRAWFPAFVIACVLVGVRVLFAAPPAEPQQKTNGYMAVGAAIGGTLGECVATDDTKRTFLTSPGNTSVPGCIPQGALLTLAARGGGSIVCLTMSSTVTFWGTTDSRAKFTLSDPNGPDGAGSCIDLPAAGSMAEQKVDLAALYTMPGARLGYCATSKTCMGTTSYVPCRVNGDCTDASAGSTCYTIATSCVTLGLASTCTDADKTSHILNILYNQGAAYAVMQTYDDGACASIRRER